ncbi:MAG: choice-of-anchor C family protein [Planctomycetota bacterium]
MKSLTVLMLLLVAPTFAATSLEDDFDGENGGVGTSNYEGFANFDVADGAVDLTGPNFFDLYPGNGLYVDLNGTANRSGTLTSRDLFSPGVYSLQFRIANNRLEPAPNEMTVSLGSYVEQFVRQGVSSFAPVSRRVFLDERSALVFASPTDDTDNGGIMIDAIRLVRETQLLTNGSFELSIFNDGTPLPGVINPTDASARTVTESPTSGDPIYVLDNGATAVLGWEAFATVPGATIDWTHDSVLAASDGERIIDLNGTPGPGGIQQTFDTVAGASYRVVFDLAGNPDELPEDPADFPVKSVRVSAGDTSEDYSFDTTDTTTTDMGWETRVFEFTATTDSTTLSFESLTPADSAAIAANLFVDFGPTIDNVGAFLLGEPGDFSGDGLVDNDDLNLLLQNWGEPADPRPFGWNGVLPTGPTIDNDELNALLVNWGAGTTATVPEPATAMLLLLTAAAARTRRASR